MSFEGVREIITRGTEHGAITRATVDCKNCGKTELYERQAHLSGRPPSYCRAHRLPTKKGVAKERQWVAVE